ncbi:hypothetical protein ACTJJ7_27590 [Phyllobacterium sp. 22229]|nr:hypothetical protein [Phyllobacterium myrsinacearum]
MEVSVVPGSAKPGDLPPAVHARDAVQPDIDAQVTGKQTEQDCEGYGEDAEEDGETLCEHLDPFGYRIATLFRQCEDHMEMR